MQTTSSPPSSSRPMPAKRPPNLSLQIGKRPAAKTIIELQTPVEDGDIEDEDEYRSSSPSSSSSESQEAFPATTHADPEFNSDDITKDLALLDQLRRSVRKNLRLRPIRSTSATSRPQQAHRAVASSSQSSDSPPEFVADTPEQRSPSPDSAFSPESAYFTPLTEFRATPLSALYHSRHASVDTSSQSTQPQSNQPVSVVPACGISPALLLARLSSPTRPLLIDTRPLNAYMNSHLRPSVNMAIPSLILRRSRKPSGAFQSLDALRQFITTEDGKRAWDELISGDDWDGDVIVYDEAMPQKDRHNAQAAAWVIMDTISPLLHHGTADYLEGGFAAARDHSYLSQLLVSSTSEDQLEITPPQTSSMQVSSGQGSGEKRSRGLGQLNTNAASRSKVLPEIEHAAPSPLPVLPSHINLGDDSDSPSPAPSTVHFTRPSPRRPSIPTLRGSSVVSLPKLQVSTVPTKSNRLAAPSESRPRTRSRSPSHLTLVHSNHSPPGSARLLSPNHSYGELPPPSPSYLQPTTPLSPRTPIPRSPSTARPDLDQPPTTEEPFPEFTVSEILPNFLYLGPELTTEEHVEALVAHNVRRIVNIAAECDDDHGLNLRDRFEKYVHIPMRDTVEEDNITRGVREVCTLLDDASLHSAPVYVHCKAGKSRSVTAVMAYLIHANHWTLSRAYEFVLARRKGISPNIGFVSELMAFEEQELGGKSVGVVKMTPSDADADSGGGNMAGNYGVALNGRRPQHMRESLPPTFAAQHSFNLVPTMNNVAQLGDSQQELEIKDAEGRYRHARRAPVDAATLQPMRRVSKAGLESAACV